MKTSSQGFTLLELLIAMSIFSLISIMSFSGLRSVLFNK
ncbi:MAG: prepilin-type N-terminal cleavage/methylation domain-containing protein, partial [Gammaproteobacteria bacterium]|nr:prepilin-type N-terminal cleavage/methylation domain-containing protein [Gammaproteobacteria bacterium]